MNILSGFKIIDDYFEFKAEDDNMNIYSVSIHENCMAAYLGAECPLSSISLEDDNTDWECHAQEILQAFRSRKTSYDVIIKKDNQECYLFSKTVRKTISTWTAPIKSFPSEESIRIFMLKHNFTSHKKVMA